MVSSAVRLQHARDLLLVFRVPTPLALSCEGSFLRVGPVAASRNSPCRRSFLRLSQGCSPGRSDVVCRRPWGFSCLQLPSSQDGLPSVSHESEKVVIPRAALARGICFCLCGCPTPLALLALSLEGSCEGSFLGVGPSIASRPERLVPIGLHVGIKVMSSRVRLERARDLLLVLRVPHPSFLGVGPHSASWHVHRPKTPGRRGISFSLTPAQLYSPPHVPD